MNLAKFMLILLLTIALAYPAAAADGEGKGKANDFRDKIFETHKERAMKWVESCYRWAERLEEKVRASNIGDEAKNRIQARIENMKGEIGEMRSKIENAKNYSELRDAMREIRTLWTELSKQMRLIAYEHFVIQMEKIIEKLEELADRFESHGLDVSSFRDAIDEASDALEGVKAKLGDGTVKYSDIANLRQKVMNAFEESKKLAREYRPKLSDGIVMANVSGSFKLNGTVMALIKGNGTVNVEPTGAKIKESKGKENVIEALVVRGKVNVTGEGDFKIIAHGNGTLTMNGNGSYTYKQCMNQKFVNGTFSDGFTINFGFGC